MFRVTSRQNQEFSCNQRPGRGRGVNVCVCVCVCVSEAGENSSDQAIYI